MSPCRLAALVYRGLDGAGIPFCVYEERLTGRRPRAYDFELLRRWQEKAERKERLKGYVPDPPRYVYRKTSRFTR